MDITKYKSLRNNIDKRCLELNAEHKSHMKCKSGCDLCCMDYSIFPVEFYHIVDALKKKKDVQPIVNKESGPSQCVFLNEHKCEIYEERPVICRTHGLPLLYMNVNSEWELSTCELNFTAFDMDNFSEENTYSQDTFNSKLFLLNKNFISGFDQTKYSEHDLIPIKEIIKHI